MFRTAISRINNGFSLNIIKNTSRITAAPAVRMAHGGPTETDEEFDARYIAYFNRKDIDGWEFRKAFHDILGYDLVPEPKIVVAMLHACRRINDYSATTRLLEALKDKCAHHQHIYSYVIQEIRPTLDELGISTPEEMGYDKPELAYKDTEDFTF